MSGAVSRRLRVLLVAAVAIASNSAVAHSAPSDEAVWFFLAALLAIPVLLIGVILLIVHLVQHARLSSRARRAASAGQTSDAANVDTTRISNAGTLAWWLIGGSVAVLALVALAGIVSSRTVFAFWRVIVVVFVVAALIVWAVRYASRRSRDMRALRVTTPAAPHAVAAPVDDAEPPAKPSNFMLWLSIVLLAIAGFAVLSPFYLMHRKDLAAKQAESARAVQKADESQRELDRAAEAASNKARIDQMARGMMGEPAPPPQPAQAQSAEQRAEAERVAVELRVQCRFYGVFNVEKRGVPYQFTLRADGTFESLNKTSQARRVGRWSYSEEPNRAGDSHMLIFKYSTGLPATEEERLAQTGSKVVRTQNAAGRYDYELLEVLDYPECNDPVRAREYPKRLP